MKVYSHPAKLSAGAMVGKGLQAVIEGLGAEEVERTIEFMGDDELLIWMKHNQRAPQAAKMSCDLLNRVLFKPVYIAEPVPSDDRNANGYATAQQQRIDLKLASPASRATAERAIAQSAGVVEDDVIIYWPENAPGLQMIWHYVQQGPGQAPSRPRSALSSRMIERHLALWKIFVFVNPKMSTEKRKNVAIAAHSFIGFENMMSAD